MDPIILIESPIYTPNESTATNWYWGGFWSISYSESEENALIIRLRIINNSISTLSFKFSFHLDNAQHQRLACCMLLLTPDDLIQPSNHPGQILRRKPCDLLSHALD